MLREERLTRKYCTDVMKDLTLSIAPKVTFKTITLKKVPRNQVFHFKNYARAYDLVALQF